MDSTQPPFTTHIAKRYRIKSTIGRGGMGIVYRVHDRLTGEDVALKRMLSQAEGGVMVAPDQSSEARLALAQEFHMLASLRHPHIISVLDYGFTRISATTRMPFFTMPLLENAQDILKAGQSAPFDTKINLIMRILLALDYMHRRGIVHRDIKPSNILVAGDDLKVVDFGVSVRRGQTPAEGMTTGTLSHIAPEVLQGHRVNFTADLYGVGMIAYELFTGAHPFPTQNMTTLIMNVLEKVPDISTLDGQPQVGAVLSRLLEKYPDDRYASAHDTMQALSDATGIPLPQETLDIRESYLQTAQFVGRDDELALLTGVLSQAIDGSGALWLVGGESGVGKTRLVDELRAFALTQGVMVVRGQARSGKASGLWRQLSRWLALNVTLSDLEAGVLKPLVPDIERITGKSTPDAPPLDADTTRSRLQSTLLLLLERLLTQSDDPKPLLLILEDLHAAGSDDIRLLTKLSQNATRLPLVALGTYRSEERPDLPAELPDSDTLHLKRLDADSIAAVSKAILGASGTREDVVDLLQRETAGNVYFLIEVVRALAQDAERLEDIGAMTLPEHVFVGGVNTVLKRRLNLIDGDDKTLLQLAAVLGRRLDLAVLRAAAPETDLTRWLNQCMAAAILDVQDNVWRFAHDKLRETLIEQFTEAERHTLNRRAAETLETVYPNQLASYAASLAQFWQLAGEATKELTYTVMAGEQALLRGAYKEALTYLRRGLTLTDCTPATAGQQCAHIHRLMGQAYLASGQLEAGRESLSAALEHLHMGIPQGKRGLQVGIVRQLTSQIGHRLGIPAGLTHRPISQVILQDAAGVYDQLAEVYYFGNRTGKAWYCALRSLNLSERAGASPLLAKTYANVGVGAALYHLPLDRVAQMYLKRGLQIARKVDNPLALAQTRLLTGLYRAGRGSWRQAETEFDKAATLFLSFGDRKRWEQTRTAIGHIECIRGDFRRCEDINVAVQRSAQQRGDLQMQASALIWQAAALTMRGEVDDALALLNIAYPLFVDSADRSLQTIGYTTLAVVQLRSGQPAKALESGDCGLKLMGQAAPTSFAALPAYAGITGMYLRLWEQTTTSVDPRLMSSAQSAVEAIVSYAKIYPIGVPYAHVFEGWLLWMMGDHTQARRRWQHALTAAQNLDMPYAHAMAHFHAGRHAFSFNERLYHLQRARDLFGGLGAQIDSNRAAQLLGGE